MSLITDVIINSLFLTFKVKNHCVGKMSYFSDFIARMEIVLLSYKIQKIMYKTF